MHSAALNINTDPVSEFQSAMAGAGILSDEIPIADGQLHRFKAVGDKNGSKNGWYILFNDGNPAGKFGSWKYGINETWSSRDYKDFTPQQRAEYAKQMAKAKMEREKAQAATHKEARASANRLWSEASPETGKHKYLQDKGVQAFRIRSNGANLLIPLRDSGGILHSIQTIDERGKKLFLSGGAIQGHYFGIGKPNGKVIIVEGYSTAATIHQATGHAVAVAFNAGNLTPVAKALRERFPDIEIIIAGDNDTQTEGNPGKSKATEAAKAVNGKLVIPEFKDNSNGATDFNDLALAEGHEQVKKFIDSAQDIEGTQEKQTNNKNLNSFAQLQCAGDVQPQPINWLWPNRIALGKLTMIAGDPGLGKSLLSIELAKHVTKGIRWPVDDTPCPIGDVVLLSAEDDLADTIRPRLDAAGANPDKVYFLESIQEIDKEGELIKRGFSLKRDVAAIEQVLEQNPQIRLIIVDPISAYLGGTDSHNNSDIRSVLSPLSELANKKKVAIVVITHLNKGSGQGSAMYRATGSLAFVAAARAVFIVTRDQDDPDRRLFLPIKNNLGTDREGFAYRVIQADNGAPIIDWENETITISADDALATLSNEDKTDRQDAISFLERELKDGAVDAKELFKSAESCGISRRTLYRAKSDLGVDSYKKDFAGSWAWRLKQEELSEGSHAQGCHPCDSTLATFAESHVNSGFQDANTANNPQGCHTDNAGDLGNIGAEDKHIEVTL